MNQKGGILRYFVILFLSLSICCLGFFLLKICNICQKAVKAEELAVVINEIAWMGTENSSNDEWIELFNNSDEGILLDNWRLLAKDGTPDIELSGVVKANNYFLLERTDDNTVANKQADLIYTGALSNAGEFLELRNEKGEVIDFLDMNDAWQAGDNESKQTISRTTDGDWLNSLNSLGTPKEKNNFGSLEIIATRAKENATSTLQATAPSPDFGIVNIATSLNKKKKAKPDIIISEIFPNPIGPDERSEFIELYNAGEEMVDLEEWQIGDESGNRFRFRGSREIRAGEFLLLRREETKIAMNNTGDTISLYKKDRKTAVSKIKYKKAKENLSLNCLTEQKEILGKLINVDCLWSETVSPGMANQIDLPNRAPEPDFSVGDFLFARTPIIFDSSDTIDRDGDSLEYFWDFGDGFFSGHPMPDHTYALPGEYEVSMRVSDGELEEEVIKTVNIIDWKIDNDLLTSSSEPAMNWGDIEISKILPNPEGADSEGEYVEILNTGKTKINLLDWQIDDAEGGSHPYIFKESVFLEPNEHYLLAREDSGLALNNSRDEVRIIAPDNTIIDLLSYNKTYEGEVYAKNNNAKWEWSGLQDLDNKKIKQQSYAGAKIKKISSAKNKQEAAIAEAASFALGTYLSVKGMVLVAPGVLGLQYFYISASSSLQIYNYKKNFPVLQIGDYISVYGELTSSKGERRLKTKTKEDIKVLSKGKAPKALELSVQDIEKAKTNFLVKTSGEIVEKRGASVFLDDGSAEILVYIKSSTNIVLDDFKVGDSLSITGILINNSNGKRLLPRSTDDIVRLDSIADNKDEGRVLGEEIESNEWTLARRDNDKEFLIYFFMIFCAFILGVLGWYIKKIKIEQ